MKNIKINPVVFAAMACLCINTAAQAQNVIGVGAPTGTIRSDVYTFGAGFEFYVPSGTGTTINSLGYWDQGGDGLGTSHIVSLYSYAGFGSTYNLLASVTVAAGTGDPLIGGYRWVNIGALALPDIGQNGGYYALLASHDGTVDPWTDGIGGSPIMNPLIGTIAGNGVVDELSGQAIPQNPIDLVGNTDPSSAYGGGNLAYIQPVPEPATSAMVGSGLALLLALRRKK